ncbi:MAG: hypothetical protein U0R26_08385 [Solirubrobacterales bacterium]
MARSATSRFYELCLPLWTGLSDEDIEAVFAGTAWMEEIGDV